MQFGKLVGTLLIVLGIVLISIQVWTSISSSQPHPEQVPAQVPQSSGVGHIPGIIGGIVAIAGAAIFVSSRRKDQDRPVHPVK